jgi:hypothetical protein
MLGPGQPEIARHHRRRPDRRVRHELRRVRRDDPVRRGGKEAALLPFLHDDRPTSPEHGKHAASIAAAPASRKRKMSFDQLLMVEAGIDADRAPCLDESAG